MDSNFLKHVLVLILLWFIHMVNESIPWHIQREGEEEMYLDNEKAHLFCLGSSFLIQHTSC